MGPEATCQPGGKHHNCQKQQGDQEITKIETILKPSDVVERGFVLCIDLPQRLRRAPTEDHLPPGQLLHQQQPQQQSEPARQNRRPGFQ